MLINWVDSKTQTHLSSNYNYILLSLPINKTVPLFYMATLQITHLMWIHFLRLFFESTNHRFRYSKKGTISTSGLHL
jgi:bifunctional pyridoxal-dependent enzyme with beta-cystathionase and maltose regulon repressor activities